MSDDEFLEHIGIMGMHWGRRKGGSGSSPSPRKLRREKNKLNKKVKYIPNKFNRAKMHTRGRDIATDVLGVIGVNTLTTSAGAMLIARGRTPAANVLAVIGLIGMGTIIVKGVRRRKTYER